MRRVKECPQCGSAVHSLHSFPQANLYSEMLARIVEIPESQLLEQASNVRCINCDLIYKQNWFAPEILERLFREAVPEHPRGWDAVSGRFSARRFELELYAYANALAAGDTTSVNRHRRSLCSLVDAIPALAGTTEAAALRVAILEADTPALRAALPGLRKTMDAPLPFSRFAGFASDALWDFIVTRVGKVRAYAELGCPLWGLLGHALRSGAEPVFLQRTESNYWAKECRRETIHCVAQLRAQAAIPILDWEDCPQNRFDVIGAFQYLDHLTDPVHFMGRLLERARAAALILDAVDQPLAIQHHTGWNIRSVQWLADRLGCELHSDFTDIRTSGNQFFLLVRRR